MDTLKDAVGMGGNKQNQSGGGLGGIGDQLSSATGAGNCENGENLLDNGVGTVKESGLDQGSRNHESAVEQMNDEHVSDFIRDQHGSKAGSGALVEDK